MIPATDTEFETRADTSRPYRLGTRRRRARQRERSTEAGASRPRTLRASSLDTQKLVETSVLDWRRSRMTERDLYLEKDSLRQQFMVTLDRMWQLYLDVGEPEKSAKWEKTFFQVRNCQHMWAGYRAGCCGDRTRAVAVPIGCNHRLCPLCSYQRSKTARVRIKTLYDRLTHPVLITLTVPNTDSIHKGYFQWFRKQVRKFIKQHEGWIRGGVYSLETTFNRKDRTWHLHCHILADVANPLPTVEEKTALAGRNVCLFTAIKLRLEFDWLRQWAQDWGRKPKPGAAANRIHGDNFEFELWVSLGRENRLKEWTPAGYRPISGLSAEEMARRHAWNRENRRSIDIRRVTDRDGAAAEVLKYITKGTAFIDLPAAIEAFSDATKGARMIQTFGSWYGVSLDTVFDPEHMDDWSHLPKCACGVNHWEPMGLFVQRDVVWGEAGRFYLKRSITHTCRGTVPRPTIRFLPPEEIEDLEWTTR